MATDNAVVEDTEQKDDNHGDLNFQKRDFENSPNIQYSKRKQKKNPCHALHLETIRKPSWMYFHLQLFSTLTASVNGELDIITAKRHLTSALQRFVGLHGAAIPVDILKLKDKEMWIRVPREDGTAVHEALAGWVNDSVRWIVKGKDEWLARLATGGVKGGQDLFKPY
ncbi:uncharacterized protein PV09_09575 [Verruconis gallopava]|uniref:Ribonucleases P/MRP subunit Pop8-like domain-containing protein n=1 Tax=Verruconis gallopava TaxID=253628 RepID=A0A0D1ZVY5_9PEZI|nr:uncharacterized protein PV09_09575 [Verruconis gallopava]KIV98627.1 hypothetical protein PV09_09575 [Verruconis gallopava]